jgi:acetoacetate decarboxylase
MTRDEILGASSMPLASPSYPKGPFRFINREYLLIHYETDADALRALLPEPLEPDGNDVFFEWMKMPDSTGFGDYEESGCGIAALYNGVKCNYSCMMFLDDESPTTGGREIWGFPKKYGIPRLSVIHETLTGTLHYDEERVALGTMVYKATPMDNGR